MVSRVAGFRLQGMASGKEPWRGWASSPGQQLPQRVDLFIVEIMISFSIAQCYLRHESKENPEAWPLLPVPGAFSSALPSVAQAPLSAPDRILGAILQSHHQK